MFSGGKSEIEDQSDMQKKCQPSSGIFPTAFQTLSLLSHISLTLMGKKKKRQNKTQTQKYPQKNKTDTHALRDACTPLRHKLKEFEA